MLNYIKYSWYNNLDIKSLDKDYIWLLISRISLLTKAPLVICAVIYTLSPEQQGIWYLFISLSAISYVAESGFASLMAQVLSSYAESVVIKDGFIVGECTKIRTIKDIILYSIKFYNKLMPIVLIVNILVGFYFLSDEIFQYKCAWFCYCAVSLLNIYLMLGISLYQGLDNVANAGKLRTIFNFTNLLFTVIALVSGLHLWSLVIGLTLSIITTIFVFIKNNRKLIIFIFKSQGFEKGPLYNGLTTTFRRYVVSYGCGYFILHIFVPIVYYIDGPIQAGKIGL